jgi:hypothetical protein
MELTLVKTRTYKLEPYGKFTISWKTPKVDKPNIISLSELQIKHETTMPLTDEQDKEIIKLMKKNKTDILTDANDFGYSFYTRAGSGFTEVWHKKLSMYKNDVIFRNLVDEGKF